MSQQESEYYRRQLDQTRRELSEVIDEVVFVERARAEAEHRNVSTTIKTAALEEEIRILKQQLHAAHQHHSSPSRSSSSQQQQQYQQNNLLAGAGGSSPPPSTSTGLIEENASLRGEIAALQAQQLSHTDMTLSAQRATTARLEQVARQLSSSESEMDMMRRRLEQAEQTERAYRNVVQERNMLENRVGALEDLLKNPNSNVGSLNNNNSKQQTQAQQLLAASQALAASSSNNNNNNAATTAQLMELRNQIEQMAKDANQQQVQVNAAVQRLSSTEREQNAAGDNNTTGNNNKSSSLGFASPGGASSISQNERTRLLAFEKTVQSLNVELASMEQKLREMEALYNDQQQRFALARKDFEADQRECDQVVAAMAAELEQLMDDNSKLRQRLRNKTQEAAESAATKAS